MMIFQNCSLKGIRIKWDFLPLVDVRYASVIICGLSNSFAGDKS